MAEGDDIPLPDHGVLARMWEADACLRQRMMESEGGLLSRWTSPTTISTPSIKNMALNYRVLEHMAVLWTDTFPYPKVFQVEYLRREVGQMSNETSVLESTWQLKRV